MSGIAPDSEIVVVVTGGTSSNAYHLVEDGEPRCGPGQRSNNTRLVARDVLGAQYRRCRTCFDLRREPDTRPGDTCPFCGQEEVALGHHLPECEGADEHFEEVR